MTFLQVATDNLTTVAVTTRNTTYTLTLPKTGHYEINVHVRSVGAIRSGSGAGYLQWQLGGTAGLSEDTGQIHYPDDMSSDTGAASYAFHAHGSYTAGQTITLFCNGFLQGAFTLTGAIEAHFVPTPGAVN